MQSMCEREPEPSGFTLGVPVIFSCSTLGTHGGGENMLLGKRWVILLLVMVVVVFHSWNFSRKQF